MCAAADTAVGAAAAVGFAGAVDDEAQTDGKRCSYVEPPTIDRPSGQCRRSW